VTNEARERDVDIVVVIDPEPLADLLVASSPRPILPTLSYGRARLGYSRRIRQEVERLLGDKGLPGERVRALLEELWRQGVELEPTTEVQAYEDEGRDEGLRLAVASPPAIYLTADASLAELREWKDVDVVANVEEVRQILLSYEDTAVVFRARSEAEAIRVHEALEAAGIEARVVSQQVPWYNGVLVVGQGFWGDIMVFEKDALAAEGVIAGLRLDSP
jgi:predicted nucleic acid-binding protein